MSPIGDESALPVGSDSALKNTTQRPSLLIAGARKFCAAASVPAGNGLGIGTSVTIGARLITGASFTGVTVIAAVSLAAENAVVPPFVVTPTLVPAVPLV